MAIEVIEEKKDESKPARATNCAECDAPLPTRGRPRPGGICKACGKKAQKAAAGVKTLPVIGGAAPKTAKKKARKVNGNGVAIRVKGLPPVADLPARYVYAASVEWTRRVALAEEIKAAAKG
jgi:hypothetical protein